MQTYSQFRPTQFDACGLALSDQQDWLVLPVIQTRDSGALEQSNFAAALERLGGESEMVQVHRFGHWGPGWFEIIIVSPAGMDLVKIAEDIERTLEDYPVLDEMDFSNREYESFLRDWPSWAAHDFCRMLLDAFKLRELSHVYDFMLDIDADTWREFYSDTLNGETWSDNNTRGPMQSAVRKCTRETLARFIREQRKVVKAA